MNTPNKRKSSADPMGNETPEKKKFIMVKKNNHQENQEPNLSRSTV